MSFNPGWSSSTDDKNVFVPDDANRLELQVIQDEKSKTKIAIYTLIDEDDGMGQLLVNELQKDPRVSFAAFRIPHRQESIMKLRFHVSTNINPQFVLNDVIDRIVQQIEGIKKALV